MCLEQTDFKSLESADLYCIGKFSNGSTESNQVSFLMVNCFSNLRKLKIMHCFGFTSLLPIEMCHRITYFESLKLFGV